MIIFDLVSSILTIGLCCLCASVILLIPVIRDLVYFLKSMPLPVTVLCLASSIVWVLFAMNSDYPAVLWFGTVAYCWFTIHFFLQSFLWLYMKEVILSCTDDVIPIKAERLLAPQDKREVQRNENNKQD